MNVDLAEELLNELGASLEDLETQHAALFQFLKDKEILTDEQIAPYLEQAGKASSVRWRAAHIRLESLFRRERQKEEDLKKNASREKGADQVPPSQNQEPKAETRNEPASAQAAPRKEEAGAARNEKQPAPDKDGAQENHASKGDKGPGPSPQGAK